LTWDTSNYDDLEEIVVHPKQIWLPDIGILNRSAISDVINSVIHAVVGGAFMPNTHRRRDETVLSRQRRRCEHEFATGDSFVVSSV